MNGAEYIAQFLVERGIDRVFLLTGGACAFVVDAIARNPAIDYVAFQHEQAAAMAADASWRLIGKPGVTVATSGPGATNLITGIACSYFDSIPSIHITGQVNMRESASYLGANVRQAGFQETNIVDIARPVCKYAVLVTSIDELKTELSKAYNIAMSGRRGPVLIDVPMNVQQEPAGDRVEYDPTLGWETIGETDAVKVAAAINAFFSGAERPLVLFGAGVGLAGSHQVLCDWLTESGIPFVASWNALTFLDHRAPNFLGQAGVYGNRGANYVVQNCDRLLVLGSRLDNRQRSGNAASFAPAAHIHVLDIDIEELKKYAPDRYTSTHVDLARLGEILLGVEVPVMHDSWRLYAAEMKLRYYGKSVAAVASGEGTVSPYAAVQALNRIIRDDAIVIADCGANLCWVYQIFERTRQDLFTSGGNSPMGYSVPAAIGAALLQPERQIVCFIGDGGFQVNIQDLQTIKANDLNITIVLLNNYGYGIIKQFQDSYMQGRHEASGRSYSLPNIQAVVEAYGLGYRRVESLGEIGPSMLEHNRATVVDITLRPDTLIEPKLEMGRPINDQFPYVSDEVFARENRFVAFKRAS